MYLNKYQKEFMADLKKVYKAPTKAKASCLKRKKLAAKWKERYPMVINSWQSNWEELLSLF